MPKRSRDESALDNRRSSTSSDSGETSAVTEHTAKYVQTNAKSSSLTMKCSLPPHKEVLSFSSLEEFESHFVKAHANRCTECKRNFPTEHFLNLHITENHDSLREARKARGEKTVSWSHTAM